ncbi:type II secretion system protein [Deinococcus sedimenti]|uniref:Uncharacterized protein n=1 Tax=Deinococcus sedimenti TaxID=1867090 RepID=A0ABQ2S9J9_9DEIO|nr:hypothetical protein [Deinococcus sedimenti]GGS02892.1 hypothetical protein GCM10008960_31890 [Deinococcus sedimenti]
MRTKGFTLIWVLIMLVVLAAVSGAMLQSANTSDRTARAVARGALIRIQERNTLTYSQRLLEANAGSLLRALPAPSAFAAGDIQSQLQHQVDDWCPRDVDGSGSQVLIYFASTACGTALPAGHRAPAVQLKNSGPDLWTMEAEFLLVAGPSTHPTVRRGLLSASYGASPASTYALLSTGDTTLDSRVQIQGDAHVDGHLTLRGPVELSGALSTSNCQVVTSGCVGTAQVTLSDARTSAMSILPTPAHPAGLTGTLGFGQAGETAAMTLPTLSGLTIVASTVDLGVLSSGEQYIRACVTVMVCTTYLGTADGALRLGNVQNAPLISAWNGVIGITPVGGEVVIRPVNPDAPSVSRSLSLVVTGAGAARIDGNLMYTQTSCSADACTPDLTHDALSLQASRVTVTSRTVRTHATVITDQFIVTAPLTLFGSLIGTPAGISAQLSIQTDARARTGFAPVGVPRLAARWRQSAVTVDP